MRKSKKGKVELGKKKKINNDTMRTSIQEHLLRPETLMMNYAYRPELSEGALKIPIFQTSTFVFNSAEEGKLFFEIALGLKEKGKREPGLIYSRLNNPDLEILEDRLTLWDNAQSCTVFESGMAAISTTLLELLKPGDVILHSEPVYGGTHYLLRNVLSRYGIEARGFRAGRERQELEEILSEKGVAERLAAIYLETPANPTNQLVDIGYCAEIARRFSDAQRPVRVLVDNTFLGPLWQHPLKHGADLVLYSATKYIGGHSDLIAGVCLGSADIMERIRTLRSFMGTMAGPWTGWLLLRSLETLKLRMTCQMKNARYVADFLADHPRVERLYYPGHLTEADEQYSIYRKQCLSPGAMISFDLVGGEREAFRFLNSLKIIKLAVSLGGTQSLAEHPSTMTSSELEPDVQLELGITEKMIRLSIGVENPEDLIADLRQALESV